jgi:hypothetical protein
MRIKVAKEEQRPVSISELLAALCYFYPQYTLQEARKLPYRHVRLLVKEANRQQAVHYYNLLQITASPHTDKGSGVKKLSDYYKGVMNNG